MLESKFSRTVECDEDQKSLEEPGWKCKNASSNSLAKIWKSLDKERKLKAGENITSPTVLPKGDDGELIPDWALEQLREQRERSAPSAVLDNGMDDGREQASDLEVALYLMYGSFWRDQLLNKRLGSTYTLPLG
jgi:hypothetical protein